ncbi:MAG: sugar ABC transporter substrate-binding protein [Armatimonadetes bacterium]|nr:sugar ABC transporter substrate-binding protein [Armatimonadota bacterium]
MNTLCRRSGLAALAILLLLALVVAGCGGDSAGDGRSKEGKTALKFWHFWSEPTQKAALMERIKAFEAENPDTYVELSELSWNDGKAKLQLAFNSSTAPDVLELGSDWVAQFSSAGVLANQKGMAGDNDSRFSAEVLAPGQWNGGTFAWPWVVDSRVLYFNKTLLASVGADTTKPDTLWSDVLAKAEQIKAKHPQAYGFGANGPDQHRLYKKIIPFFWSNGGQVMDANGTPTINSPQNIQALEAYLELARTGLIETQKALDQQFVQGNVGFWISGPWLADRIRKDNPGLRFGLQTMPGFAGHQAVSFGGGEYLAINNASKQKEAAKKLVVFLTSAKQSLEFCKALPGGMTPADLSVAGDPFLQSEVRKHFTAQMKAARFTPVHPKWLDIEAIVEEEVSQAILGNKEAAQALNDAQYRLTQLTTGEAANAAETAGH